MKNRYAISDIHGCYKTLNALLFDKLRITKDDEIFFVGDYIDRGPRSKEVLDLLMDLKIEDYNVHFVRGNHEQMMIDSMKSLSDMELWILNGCNETLNSFGVFETSEIPIKYINFINEMPNYIELDEYILVHAGLNFDIENPLDDQTTMLWIRNSIPKKEKINNKKMIVGHTPKTIDEIVISLKTDKITIDGGCCYHHRYSSLGNLVALNIDTLELTVQKNIDL